MVRVAPRPSSRRGLVERWLPEGELPFVTDPWLVLPALVILGVSLAALFSVVYHPMAFELNPGLATDLATPFTRHLLWGALGIVGMSLVAALDPSLLRSRARWLYAAGLLLLVATLVVGVKVRNIRAWLSLGIVTFQPSELVKVVLVIALARYLARPERRGSPLRTLLGCAVIVGVPAALVLKQPDMGTVIVYMALLVTMPFAAGLPSRYLVLTVLAGTLAVVRLLAGIAQEQLGFLPPGVLATILSDPRPSMLFFGACAFVGSLAAVTMVGLKARNAFTTWLFAVVPAGAWLASFLLGAHLKAYQKLRLLTFLAPQLDPKGSGYNIIQSQIAFGSGGISGQGLHGATQSALGFLPERQTDFIFSVIGEVFGFAGVALVVLAFVALCLRVLWIGSRSSSRFGGLLCAGYATIVMTHMAVNMGMAIGIMPIMGIPLPLASYGGTAMLATFLMLGVVLAVERDARDMPQRRRPAYRPGAELEDLNRLTA